MSAPTLLVAVSLLLKFSLGASRRLEGTPAVSAGLPFSEVSQSCLVGSSEAGARPGSYLPLTHALACLHESKRDLGTASARALRARDYDLRPSTPDVVSATRRALREYADEDDEELVQPERVEVGTQAQHGAGRRGVHSRWAAKQPADGLVVVDVDDDAQLLKLILDDYVLDHPFSGSRD